MEWFRKKYQVLIFAIPSGGFRSKTAAARIKAEGGVKGIPDLFVPAWKLFIEMKRQKGGSLSVEQKERIPELEAAGYTVLVAKGKEDAMRQVEKFVSESQEN